ncbi:hypothetical protein T484DRAFT_2027959, partial [Baffinella frigidus]
MQISKTGNVGINNASPAYKLDVNGDINTTGTISIDANNTEDFELLKFNTGRPWSFWNRGTDAGSFLELKASSDGKYFKISNKNGNPIANFHANTTNNFVALSRLSVGQNLNSPNHTLDVSGDVNITGSYKINGSDISTDNITFTNSLLRTDNNVNLLYNSSQFNITNNLLTLTNPPTTGGWVNQTSQALSSATINNVSFSSGNVLINKTTPATSTHINGLTNPLLLDGGISINISGYYMRNGVFLNADDWAEGASNKYYTETKVNTLIQKATLPLQKLTLDDDLKLLYNMSHFNLNAASHLQIEPTLLNQMLANAQWTKSGDDIYYNGGHINVSDHYRVRTIADGSGPRIGFGNLQDAYLYMRIGAWSGVNNIENNSSRRLDIKYNANVIMTINNNVGINRTSPSYKLDVAGGACRLDNVLIGRLGTNTSYTQFMYHTLTDDSTNYALLQESAGTTFLNASANKTIHFRIGNSTKMQLKANGEFNVNIITTPDLTATNSYLTTIHIGSWDIYSWNGGYRTNLGSVIQDGDLAFNHTGGTENQGMMWLRATQDSADSLDFTGSHRS